MIISSHCPVPLGMEITQPSFQSWLGSCGKDCDQARAIENCSTICDFSTLFGECASWSLLSSTHIMCALPRYDCWTRSKVCDKVGNCPRVGSWALVSGYCEDTIAVSFESFFIAKVRLPGHETLPLFFAHAMMLEPCTSAADGLLGIRAAKLLYE